MSQDFVLQLTSSQTARLQAAIMEIPGKYCNPLIDFINALIAENATKPAEKPEAPLVEAEVLPKS